MSKLYSIIIGREKITREEQSSGISNAIHTKLFSGVENHRYNRHYANSGINLPAFKNDKGNTSSPAGKGTRHTIYCVANQCMGTPDHIKLPPEKCHAGGNVRHSGNFPA